MRRRKRKAVRFEQHMKAILSALDGVVLSHRVPQPAATTEIDFVVRLRSPQPLFDVLENSMRGRKSLIEHYSHPPRPFDVARCLRKLTVAEEDRVRSSRTERTPLLIIACRDGIGAARTALLLEARDVPGIWRATLANRCEVIVVDGTALPKTPAFDGWKLMLRVDGWEDNLARLLGNVENATLQNRKITEAVMNELKRADFGPEFPLLTKWYNEAVRLAVAKGTEDGLAEGARIGREEGARIGREEGARIGREEGARIGREEGARIGREEGARIGREEGARIGREALLQVVAEVVDAAQLDELRMIESLEDLAAAVRVALREIRP
jgi:hypothetical protein